MCFVVYTFDFYKTDNNSIYFKDVFEHLQLCHTKTFPGIEIKKVQKNMYVHFRI